MATITGNVTIGGIDPGMNPLVFDVIRTDNPATIKTLTGSYRYQYPASTDLDATGYKNTERVIVYSGLVNADYVSMKALEGTTVTLDDQGNFGGFFNGGKSIFVTRVESSVVYAQNTDNSNHRYQVKIHFIIA